MKKILKQVFSISLAAAFGLAGCRVTDVSKEDIRTIEPVKPVIEGINGVFDESVPGPGKVIISRTLTEKMKDSGLSDEVFHVSVTIYCDISGAFKYKGKTLDEYCNDPALVFYREQYDIWREEIYKPLDKKMTAAEKRGDKEAIGWEKHDVDQLFEEYYHDNQAKDIIAGYELARQQYNEADRAYADWQDSPDGARAVRLELYNTESGRLKALGYSLETETGGQVFQISLAGRLTRKQIEEFPADDKYGYMIKWADSDNINVIAASMSETEKIEIEVRLKPYIWDEMMAAFKSAFPEEYVICAAEDARDPQMPCPNPNEAQPAIEVRAKFCRETYYPRKLNAFREKYRISDEDWIMGAYGNTQDAPSLQMRAGKATILKFMEDKDITYIQPLTNDEITND